MPEITLDVSHGVAVLTLNRPESLNAVTTSMCDAIISAFDATDADESVRAVIVTGAARAFCAGYDLSSGSAAFDRSNDQETGAPRDSGGRVTLRIYRSIKPVIAAVNGPAVGFGASMILPMDFRIAADTAKLGYPFTARGIIPDGSSSWFLPRIVGINRALDWTLTGRVFGAAEALEAGLVRSLHPAGQLLDAAHSIAQQIVQNAAPVSVALTRQLMWQMLGVDHPMRAHELESAGLVHTGSSVDAAEGVNAFLEKRPAVWSMRPNADLPAWYPWRPEPSYNGHVHVEDART